MATARTFEALVGSGTGGAVAVGDKLRATAGTVNVEQIRQAMDIFAYLPDKPLGGAEIGVITGAATWAPVPGYIEQTLNGDALDGLTLNLVVWSYTSDASTAVQLRLRNVTDSTNAATSTSHSGTSATKETISTVTLASGVKVYRLEILGGAAHHVYGWGHIKAFVTPS